MNMQNNKKSVYRVAAITTIAVIIIAIFLLANQAYTFKLDEYFISKATAHDFRQDEPYIKELQKSEIEELASRLSIVSNAIQSDKYSGFTPLYSITAMLDDREDMRICGYSATKDMLDIYYKGKTYSVDDLVFTSYVDEICSVRNTTSVNDLLLADSSTYPTDNTPMTELDPSDVDDAAESSIPENETLRVDSPNGAYRAEAYGTNRAVTAAGMYPYEGLRVIRNSGEMILWNSDGCYMAEFLWSSDSKYVAVYTEARIYGESFVVAADTGKVIDLPSIGTISSQLVTSSQPSSTRPDPYFKVIGWVNDTTVRVNYRWITQEGEKAVSGTYEYDIISGDIISNTFEIGDPPG